MPTLPNDRSRTGKLNSVKATLGLPCISPNRNGFFLTEPTVFQFDLPRDEHDEKLRAL